MADSPTEDGDGLGAPAVWDILKKGAGKGVDGMVSIRLTLHAQHRDTPYSLLHIATARKLTSVNVRVSESARECQRVPTRTGECPRVASTEEY